MMKNRNIYITIIMTLLALASCQKDELHTGPCGVKVKLYGKKHVEVTRAAGYQPLELSSSALAAGLYVTMGDQEACFPMEWNGATFGSNVFLDKGDYTFYSCIPLRERNTTFTNGADDKFELTEIPGLGTDDIMISHAAVNRNINNEENITLPMNMDHIMACVSPHFYLHDEYAALRSIEILAVEFAIFDGENISIPYYKAAATYSGDEKFDIVWGDETTVASTKWVKVYEAESSAKLSDKKVEALERGNCYVSPKQSTEHLKMRVTYNVYDKNGLLVREKVQAVNSINKLSGLSQEKTLTAGSNYKLYIKIVPSYLYVLSDNDESTMFVIND